MTKSKPTSKGGRPSKYRERYVDELIEHFESYLREPYTKEVIKEMTSTRKDGSTFETVEYKLIAKPLPSLFGFARKIGVRYSTVYRWASQRVGDLPEDGEPDERPFKFPEFCNAYKEREHYQAEYLQIVGMGNFTPAPWPIFTAKNVLGWRDVVDSQLLDKNGQPTNASTGYIILPSRMTQEEATAEYAKSTRPE